MKSPFYRLQWRGSPATATLLVVPLPKDIESATGVDLYAWHDGEWRWLPNHKIPGEGIIESQLDFTPESVVVMSTHPVNPNVSADYPANATVPDQIKEALVEINPQGLMIGDRGQIDGNLQSLPPEIENSTLTILPTIRNWLDDGTVRADLVNNMLVDDTSRTRHVRAIVDLVQRNAWQGIDLDYRNISPDLQAEYVLFLQELHEALPDNKLLSVSVALPQQVSAEEWQTGGYDWQAIGQIANVVKVPTSPNPADYRAGGKMETLLNWAIGQVNRYKIQLMLSTLSTEEINGTLHQITYQQALDPLGSAATVGENTVALPGDKLDFTLGGMPSTTGIQFDKASGAYWYAFLDPNGAQRTIYLENAASIARKLQLLAQYNLRGVAIQGLLREDNDAQIWNVIRQFLELVIPPIENQYSVVWRVQGQDGGIIDEALVDLSSPTSSGPSPMATAPIIRWWPPLPPIRIPPPPFRAAAWK